MRRPSVQAVRDAAHAAIDLFSRLHGRLAGNERQPGVVHAQQGDGGMGRKALARRADEEPLEESHHLLLRRLAVASAPVGVRFRREERAQRGRMIARPASGGRSQLGARAKTLARAWTDGGVGQLRLEVAGVEDQAGAESGIAGRRAGADSEQRWIVRIGRPGALGNRAPDAHGFGWRSAAPNRGDVAGVGLQHGGDGIEPVGSDAVLSRAAVDPGAPQLRLEQPGGDAEGVPAEEAISRPHHRRVHREEYQPAHRSEQALAGLRVDRLELEHVQRRVDRFLLLAQRERGGGFPRHRGRICAEGLEAAVARELPERTVHPARGGWRARCEGAFDPLRDTRRQEVDHRRIESRPARAAEPAVHRRVEVMRRTRVGMRPGHQEPRSRHDGPDPLGHRAVEDGADGVEIAADQRDAVVRRRLQDEDPAIEPRPVSVRGKRIGTVAEHGGTRRRRNVRARGTHLEQGRRTLGVDRRWRRGAGHARSRAGYEQCQGNGAGPDHGRSAEENWMRKSMREENSASTDLPDRTSALIPVSKTRREDAPNDASACQGSSSWPRRTRSAARPPPKPPAGAEI